MLCLQVCTVYSFIPQSAIEEYIKLWVALRWSSKCLSATPEETVSIYWRISVHSLADVYGMDPQPSTEFVQILNVNRNHWIVISTVNCPAPTVDVHDSFDLSLSSCLKKLVADLLQSPSEEITIRYCDVQWQSGGSDCSGVCNMHLQWNWPSYSYLYPITYAIPSFALCWKTVLRPCSLTNIEHGNPRPKQAVLKSFLSSALANYLMMEQQWCSVLRAQNGTMLHAYHHFKLMSICFVISVHRIVWIWFIN